MPTLIDLVFSGNLNGVRDLIMKNIVKIKHRINSPISPKKLTLLYKAIRNNVDITII
jgi:hypothetical protein